jgi:hypothetical protein
MGYPQTELKASDAESKSVGKYRIDQRPVGRVSRMSIQSIIYDNQAARGRRGKGKARKRRGPADPLIYLYHLSSPTRRRARREVCDAPLELGTQNIKGSLKRSHSGAMIKLTLHQQCPCFQRPKGSTLSEDQSAAGTACFNLVSFRCRSRYRWSNEAQETTRYSQLSRVVICR